MTVSKSGGSSAIHDDGTPLQIEIGNSETVTVPDGKTWVIYLFYAAMGDTTTTDHLNIIGSSGQFEVFGATESGYADVDLLHGGDQIEIEDTGKTFIRGWVL